MEVKDLYPGRRVYVRRPNPTVGRYGEYGIVIDPTLTGVADRPYVSLNIEGLGKAEAHRVSDLYVDEAAYYDKMVSCAQLNFDEAERKLAVAKLNLRQWTAECARRRINPL